MKRYFFIAGVAHEGKDGSWVKAEDAILSEELLTRRVQELEKENESLKHGIKEIESEATELSEL